MSSPSPPAEVPLPRHRLVRVQPAAWQSLMDARPDLAAEALVRHWAASGWPLIARRRGPADGDGILLGLPLPPSAGKRRIAVEMQAGDILSTGPLPGLSEVLGTAPVDWQPCLHALMRLARTYQVRGGVFGSLCWQWLTGLTYLSPSSDLDIAWTLPRRRELEGFLGDLAAIDARAPMRLDGELLDPNGAGANWRELHAGGPEVALKTSDRVQLCARADFVGPPP